MKTVEEIQQLIRQCRDAKLEGLDTVRSFRLQELAEIYNGIGPDRFPEQIRHALDRLHPSLLPVALIHDVQYHIGGTKKDFTASNELFKANGRRMAFFNYRWYDPRRYLVWNKARIFGNLCQAFGWKGWREWDSYRSAEDTPNE